MKINGVATMHAPADRVWAALNDPAVLVAAIPGCERLETTGPDSYRFILTAAVASIQGTYSGEISLSDRREPSSFVLTASGAGGPGTVSTSVQIRLAATADGITELSYDADAVVAGMLAGVGHRVLASVAKRVVGDFFISVDDVLSGTGARGALAAELAAGANEPATTAAPAGVYFPPEPSGPAASQGFGRGVLVGAAAALAGVAVGSLLGRKGR